MADSALLEVHFDPGNGAIFKIEHEGRLVRCFLSQDNAFFARRAGRGQFFFPDIFSRHTDLIASAAALNISSAGISNDPWGNLITDRDLEAALRGAQSNNSFKPKPLRGSA